MINVKHSFAVQHLLQTGCGEQLVMLKININIKIDKEFFYRGIRGSLVFQDN